MDGIALEWIRTESLNPALSGIGADFLEMSNTWDSWVESFAQNWLRDHIEAFQNEIDKQEPENKEELDKILEAQKSKIKDMKIPRPKKK